MIREEREIIEAIKIMGYDRTAYPREKVSAVISMAIEALQAEPNHGRLIDADAMVADLLTVDPQYEPMIQWCITIVEAQPTVQADRPHGEWIDIDNYYRLATCSHCHKVTMFEKWGEHTKPYDYCPN